jgi:hypothetical protein
VRVQVQVSLEVQEQVKDSDFGELASREVENLKLSVWEAVRKALESLMVPAWMVKERDSEGGRSRKALGQKEA